MKANRTCFADQPRDHGLQFVHGLYQVNDAALEDLLSAERQQLPGQARRALRRRPDLGGIAARQLVRGQLLDQEFAEAQDHGEQIVEVVGDAAGEPSDRFHALRLPCPLFRHRHAVRRRPSAPAIGGFAQLARDRRTKAMQLLFPYDVVRPGPHRLDDGVIVRVGGDDDAGQIGVEFPEGVEDVRRAKCRQRGVGQDQVTSAEGHGSDEVGAGLDETVMDREAGSCQLPAYRFSIGGGRADEQNSQSVLGGLRHVIESRRPARRGPTPG